MATSVASRGGLDEDVGDSNCDAEGGLDKAADDTTRDAAVLIDSEVVEELADGFLDGVVKACASPDMLAAIPVVCS